MRLGIAMLLCVASTVAARSTQVLRDAGMPQGQVIQKLGQPLSSRSYGSFTYLLYKNGCEATCGMNDLVVLDSNKVVDAIFRSPARRYTGNSSSPKMIPPAEAKKPGAKPDEKTDAKAPPKTPPKKPQS